VKGEKERALRGKEGLKWETGSLMLGPAINFAEGGEGKESGELGEGNMAVPLCLVVDLFSVVSKH